MFFIYALADPRTSQIRYVGCTKNPTQRLKEHAGAGEWIGKLGHWLHELKAGGYKPIMVVLQTTDDKTAEGYWIRHFETTGADLLNVAMTSKRAQKTQAREARELALAQLTPAQREDRRIALRRGQRSNLPLAEKIAAVALLKHDKP